jgi:hypothetical protein
LFPYFFNLKLGPPETVVVQNPFLIPPARFPLPAEFSGISSPPRMPDAKIESINYSFLSVPQKLSIGALS